MRLGRTEQCTYLPKTYRTFCSRYMRKPHCSFAGKRGHECKSNPNRNVSSTDLRPARNCRSLPPRIRSFLLHSPGPYMSILKYMHMQGEISKFANYNKGHNKCVCARTRTRTHKHWPDDKSNKIPRITVISGHIVHVLPLPARPSVNMHINTQNMPNNYVQHEQKSDGFPLE